MNKNTFRMIILSGLFLLAGMSCAKCNKPLDKSFELGGPRLQEIQYYIVETKISVCNAKGERIHRDLTRLYLKCVPLKEKNQIQYTCIQFEIGKKDSLPKYIPRLKNWTYIISMGYDEKGQVLGIDHTVFEQLKDQHDQSLSQDQNYFVYNTFLDFHSICDVFAEAISAGNSVQDLKKIGDKVVHFAAFSEVPVNLGTNVSEGSYFKNGEVTLLFKGISTTNHRTCAMLGYDSGESSFQMIMKPVPEVEIRVVGSSHYMGDIYKDMDSKWVQKADLFEFVITETTLPVPPNKINSIVERQIEIRNVNEEEMNSVIYN